jgi:hypothetical protein
MSNEIKAADERARKSAADCERLANELRSEQEHSHQIEINKNDAVSHFAFECKLLKMTRILCRNCSAIVKYEVRIPMNSGCYH